MTTEEQKVKEERPPRPHSRPADQNLLRLGRQLVELMFALIRTSRTHQPNHPLTLETAQRLLEIIRKINSLENEVELGLFLGLLKLNDIWLKTPIVGQSCFSVRYRRVQRAGYWRHFFWPFADRSETGRLYRAVQSGRHLGVGNGDGTSRGYQHQLDRAQ